MADREWQFLYALDYHQHNGKVEIEYVGAPNTSPPVHVETVVLVGAGRVLLYGDKNSPAILIYEPRRRGSGNRWGPHS